MAKRPPFLFVGTAKSGTTSLYEYLRQHPELFIPKKETFFYLKDIYQKNILPYPFQRSFEDMILEDHNYRNLYEFQGERIRGEVGTGYLYYYEKSIPLIQRVMGYDTRILIILRDPVARAYSSYKHFLKDLHEDCSFEESLLEEAQRIERNWDFMWHYKSLGLYYKQVKAYKESFPNVMVVFYEELQEDSKELMDRIFDFIGVDSIEGLNTERHFNPSGDVRFKILQKLVIHNNPIKSVLKPFIRKLFSRERRAEIQKNLKNSNLKEYSEMKESTRLELIDFFRNDIESLEHLLDLDLSHWKEPIRRKPKA